MLFWLRGGQCNTSASTFGRMLWFPRTPGTDGGRAVAAPDRFIAWCKQEQASIEQQLELMRSGKVRTGKDEGSGWVDTTTESIERAKARLAELNELLTEAGSATVSKPGTQ